MLAAIDLPLNDAIQALRRFKMVEPRQAAFDLERTQITLQCASILHTLEPDQYHTLKNDTYLLLPENVSTQMLEEAALEAINRRAPIDIEHMQEVLYNYDGGFYLEPALYGFTLQDELIWEALDSPEDYFNQSSSLFVFIKLLDGSVTHESIWDSCAEYFAWPDGLAKEAQRRRGRDDLYLDDDSLFRRLKRRRLMDFQVAFKTIWQSTGTVYLDFTEDYQEYTEAIPFTIENVRHLEQHWKAAQPMIEQIESCQEMVERDPDILLTLAKVWNLSLKKRAKNPQAGKTLAEILGGAPHPYPEPEEDGDEQDYDEALYD